MESKKEMAMQRVIAARRHISDAIVELDAYVALSGDQYLRRTMLAQLEIYVGIGSWMHNERTLDDVISMLEEYNDD